MRVAFLVIAMLLGSIWLMFPYDYDPNNWIAFFKFSDQKLPWQNYVYHLSDKFILAILAWLILQKQETYRLCFWVFFVTQLVRIVDYLFTYNEVWTWIKVPSIQFMGEVMRFPVDTNTCGMAFLILSIGYEFVKSYGNSNRL